ncbi:hypothetical protein Tco_1378605 [Tanacetum coccineum]
MDDPNITMEEYIRLEEEKARKRGKVFNWKTLNMVISRISFDESDDEDYTVVFDKNSFSYKIISANDLKTVLENDNDKVNMPSFPSPEPHQWNYLVNGMLFNLIKNLYVPFGIPFDPQRLTPIRHMEPLPPRDQRHLWLHYQVEGYTEEIDLAERLRMIYTGDDGQEVFVSHAWRRLFEIRIPLVQEFILELFNTCRIGSLHTAEEMTDDGFGEYWLGSERMIHDKGDLSDYWVEISSGKDFLRGAPSYTYIRDPMRRLCHRCEGKLLPYVISTVRVQVSQYGVFQFMDTAYWPPDLAEKKSTMLVKYL